MEIACPQCGVMLKASDDTIGKTVRCSGCRKTFVVGASDPASPTGPTSPWPVPPGPVPTAPYPGQPPFGTGGYYGPEGRTSGMATASLVLGIISIPTCLFYGVPSLICGILGVVFAGSATKSVYPDKLAPSSAGLAKAGRICGWVGIALSIAFWVFLLIVIAIATSSRSRYYH